MRFGKTRPPASSLVLQTKAVYGGLWLSVTFLPEAVPHRWRKRRKGMLSKWVMGFRPTEQRYVGNENGTTDNLTSFTHTFEAPRVDPFWGKHEAGVNIRDRGSGYQSSIIRKHRWGLHLLCPSTRQDMSARDRRLLTSHPNNAKVWYRASAVYGEETGTVPLLDDGGLDGVRQNRASGKQVGGVKQNSAPTPRR